MITLDTHAPNGTLIAPKNNSYNYTATQNYTVNLTDNIALSNATLFIYNSTNNIVNQSNVTVSGTNAIVGIVVKLSDGIYKCFYNVFDLAGNTFYTNNNTIIIDTIKSNVNLTYPLNTTYNIDVSVINYSYSDINPGSCWYSNSSGIWNSSINPAGTNFSNVITKEGGNNIIIYCNDSAGNTNSSNISFFKDTIYPNVNLTYPLNTTYNINISVLNYSYFDSNPGSCWYSNSSGVWNSTINPAGTNFSTVITTEGGNNLIIYCNDTAGNTNSSNISFFKDTIYPIVQFGDGTLANLTNISQNFVYVNVTINETNFVNITFSLYNNTNGVTLVNSTNYTTLTYTMNWTNLPDSVYYYNVTVFDIVSYKNSTDTRKITLDTHAPNGTLIAPKNNSYNSTATQNYTINLTDNLGLKNATLNIYNSTNNLVNQSNISVSGTNALVGIVVTLTDGIYKLFYNIFDNAGNSFNSQNNTITIDTIKPAININYPLNTNYNTNVSTLNYTYLDANPTSCWYSNSSGKWNSTINIAGDNFTDVITQEGWNNLTLYCNDSAGNTNSSNISFFKDTIIPQLSIIYPENITYYITNVSNINYSYYDLNPGSCWYTDSNGIWNSSIVNAGTNFTNVISDAGTNSWTVYCNDSAGNTISSKVNFNKNTNVPTIIIDLNSPLNNSGFTNTTILFNYNVTSENSIDNCSLIINNDIVETNYSIDKLDSISFVYDGLNIGKSSWSINCYGNLSSYNSSETRYITVINSSNNTFDGSSTDLSQTDIRNITNLLIENTNFGLINFTEPVNLENAIDFNSNIVFSNNLISINTVNLPQLDKPATLTLYNLEFKNPVIMVNNQYCYDCNKLDYSGNNLKFTVSHFSSYSAAENSKLSIWDDSDKMLLYNGNDTIYANYTDQMNNPILSAICNIELDNNNYEMNYNISSGVYQYTTSFSQSGNYNYTIDCDGSSSGYTRINLTDNINIGYAKYPDGAKINEIGSSREENLTTPDNITSVAGNLSEINLDTIATTDSWQGYYGDIHNIVTLKDSRENIFYNWSDALPQGQIFASRSDNVNFYSVSCIKPEQISAEESYLGQQISDSDSITNTFNSYNHPMFYIGAKKIENNSCISTNIFNIDGKDPLHFYELMLTDDGSNVIYATVVDNKAEGFNHGSHDFEMLVGDNGHSGDTNPTPYYFFVELQ